MRKKDLYNFALTRHIEGKMNKGRQRDDELVGMIGRTRFGRLRKGTNIAKGYKGLEVVEIHDSPQHRFTTDHKS